MTGCGCLGGASCRTSCGRLGGDGSRASCGGHLGGLVVSSLVGASVRLVVGTLVGLAVGALVGTAVRLVVRLAVSHPFAIQILMFARPPLISTTEISMSETEKVAPVESLASNSDSAYPEPSPALTTMT